MSDDKRIAKTGGGVKTEEGLVFDSFNKLGAIKKAVSEAQLSYLRTTLFSTLEPNDILLVLYKAHNLKLDVLNDEMTAYRNSKGQLVMIVGKDAKIRLAKSTGLVASFTYGSIWRKKIDYKDAKTNSDMSTYIRCEAWEGGELWGAWASIKRSDEAEPYRVQVSLKEYHMGNTMWNSKPETMIIKVAKSQVCTVAFPELFAGVYEEEEVPSVGEVKSLPVAENAMEPATESQLKTIEALKGDTNRTFTFQQAAEYIRELSQKKKGVPSHVTA